MSLSINLSPLPLNNIDLFSSFFYLYNDYETIKEYYYKNQPKNSYMNLSVSSMHGLQLMYNDNFNWKKIPLNSDLVMEHKSITNDKNQSLVCLRAYIHIPYDIEYVYSVLISLEKRNEWDNLLQSSEVIENLDEDNDIIHLTYNNEPQMSRDFCLLVTHQQTEEGFIVAARSILHPKCPVNTTSKRAEVLSSGFILHPAKRKGETEVVMILNCDEEGTMLLADDICGTGNVIFQSLFTLKQFVGKNGERLNNERLKANADAQIIKRKTKKYNDPSQKLNRKKSSSHLNRQSTFAETPVSESAENKSPQFLLPSKDSQPISRNKSFMDKIDKVKLIKEPVILNTRASFAMMHPYAFAAQEVAKAKSRSTFTESYFEQAPRPKQHYMPAPISKNHELIAMNHRGNYLKLIQRIHRHEALKKNPYLTDKEIAQIDYTSTLFDPSSKPSEILNATKLNGTEFSDLTLPDIYDDETLEQLNTVIKMGKIGKKNSSDINPLNKLKISKSTSKLPPLSLSKIIADTKNANTNKLQASQSSNLLSSYVGENVPNNNYQNEQQQNQQPLQRSSTMAPRTLERTKSMAFMAVSDVAGTPSKGFNTTTIKLLSPATVKKIGKTDMLEKQIDKSQLADFSYNLI